MTTLDRLSVTDSHRTALQGLFKPSGQCLAEGNYMDSRSWGNATRAGFRLCIFLTSLEQDKIKALIKAGVGGSRV